MKRQSILVASVISLFLLTWWVGYSVIGNIDWSAEKPGKVETNAASVQDAQTNRQGNNNRVDRGDDPDTDDDDDNDDENRVFANQGWKIDSTDGNVPKACLNFTAKLDPKDNLKVIDYMRTVPETNLTAAIAGKQLCLTGFDYNESYSLTLLKGLPSAKNGTLSQDKMLSVSFGSRPPFVSFAGSGVILPRIGAQGLAIETVNVDELQIHIYRVGDRMIARRDPNIGEATAEGDYSYEYRNAATDIREQIWQGTLPIAAEPNTLITTVLPLNELVGELKPGAYVVSAVRTHEDDEYRIAKAWRWIISTDLALTTYKSTSGLDISVRSIDSAKPVKNTRVDLIARNNEVLGSQDTDANGRVHFDEAIINGTGTRSPRMLMAYGQQGDYAMLDFNRSPLDLSAFPIGGRYTGKSIDSYVFPDRGVYRPGETVHMTAMLRDQLGIAAQDRKGQIKFLKPNRQEFRTFRFDGAKGGTLLQDFDVPASAPRGVWRAVVEVDGLGQVGASDFSVEDFVPQKLRVDVKIDETPLQLDEMRSLEIVAQFLYGADGAGLEAEAQARIRVDPKPFPALKDYHFGRADKPFREFFHDIGGGVTDGAGVLELGFELSEDEDEEDNQLDTTQPLRAEITVGAAEPGGRYVQNSTRIPVRTQDVYIGVDPEFDGRARRNKPANFKIKAVDWQGKAIDLKDASWTLVEEDWDYNWFRSRGEWQYRYEIRDTIKANGKFNIDAEDGASLTRTLDWGSYRLVVRGDEGMYEMSYRFYVGWGGTSTSDAPDKVSIGVEDVSKRSGNNVKLTVKAPYAGYGELVIAGEEVHSVRTVKIPEGGSEINVKLDKDWGAGVYALLTVYTPRTIGERPVPRRAVGIGYISLDVNAQKLDVSLKAPEVTKPRQKQKITVNVGNVPRGETVMLTLAAVDEGVLQVTKYKSPDPQEFYFGKKALRVDVRDDYARLLNANIGAPSIAKSGGDSLGGEGLTTTPIKVVSLYSGPVKLKGGKAIIPVNLPDFNGEIRLMAVAWSDSAVGSASEPMKVRDAVPTILALPRFLAPGDKAVVTASFDNIDGKSGTYSYNLSQEGDLSIDDASAKIDLANGERKTVTSLLMTSQTGVNSVSMDFKGPGGFKIRSTYDIQTRTPFMPMTRMTSARVAAGNKFTIDQSYMEGFDPGTVDVSVSFARTPGLDPSAYAASVSAYPYGCTEQTVSRALPLLYANDLGGVAGIPENKARILLQEAVDKIANRQGGDGAFGLWSVGDGYTYPWVGVYAADFLQRASEKEYVVSANVLNKSYDALTTITKMENYPGLSYYWRYGSERTSSRNTRQAEAAAYAHYVLARAGRGELRSMRYFYDNHSSKLESPIAWGHIGAALAMMDDKGRSEKAFARGLKKLGYEDEGDYYQSPLRDAAGFLALANEVDAGSVLNEAQEGFQERLKAPNHLHTQEKAQTILAIRSMLLSSDPVKISANGADVSVSKGIAKAHLYGTELRNAPSFTNNSSSEVWNTVMVTGSPLKAPLPKSKGYDLEKTIFTMEGEEANLTSVQQGTKFIVKVDFSSQNSLKRQTVIADLLPAGMEIEKILTPQDARRQCRWCDNEEEDQGPFAFLGELSDFQTTEMRDDRMVAALETYREDTYTIAYIVRAVTPGDFVWPGAVVENMYKPQEQAVSKATRVTIISDQEG